MFIIIDFEKNTGVLEIFTRHIFGLCVLAGLLGFAGFFHLLGFFNLSSPFSSGFKCEFFFLFYYFIEYSHDFVVRQRYQKHSRYFLSISPYILNLFHSFSSW